MLAYGSVQHRSSLPHHHPGTPISGRMLDPALSLSYYGHVQQYVLSQRLPYAFPYPDSGDQYKCRPVVTGTSPASPSENGSLSPPDSLNQNTGMTPTSGASKSFYPHHHHHHHHHHMSDGKAHWRCLF